MVGGLAKSDVVRQIFSDIMGVELVTLKYMDEVATVGAAIMGGIALGIYKDYSDVKKFHAISAHNVPNMENHEKYKKILALYQKGTKPKSNCSTQWQNYKNKKRSIQ